MNLPYAIVAHLELLARSNIILFHDTLQTLFMHIKYFPIPTLCSYIEDLSNILSHVKGFDIKEGIHPIVPRMILEVVKKA